MILTNIKNNKESGFTIVELLVVIVVIGVLAAITVVSYTGITAKSNAAANKSNAQSIMAAADAYFAENGVYPTIAQLSAGTNTVKVPTTVTTGLVGTAATSTNLVTYATNGSTGYCIEYWDSGAATPIKATLASAGGYACP